MAMLKRQKQWDESSVDSMVREYYPKIFAYVYRRILNESNAKDLTQETFCRFFQNFNQYQEQGKMLNYLYRIAYHLICDASKAGIVIHDEIDEIADITYDSHQVFMKKEQTILLRKWVNSLSPELKELLYLRYEEGLKYKDIAQITGIHVSTIKSRVQLAIQLLQQKEREEQIR